MSDAGDNRSVSAPEPRLPADLAPPTAADRSGREEFPVDLRRPEPTAADRSSGEEFPADLRRPELTADDQTLGEPAAIEPSGVGGDPAARKRARASLGLTRTSAAWLGVWAGVLAVIVLIIFVAQNTYSVEISFLWLHGRISLALALLIAGVAGAAVAMAIAAGRILQLRRLVRRAR